jgi:uncharacterized protein
MLHLHELTAQETYHKKLSITERLPRFISVPCDVAVAYAVEKKEDFFLMNLEVLGAITVTCQRCLEEFSLSYHNLTTIAVVQNDERAEQLLEHYESIVSPNWEVFLDDVVVDELHLYAPQTHTEHNDCAEEIKQFLIEKSEFH